MRSCEYLCDEMHSFKKLTALEIFELCGLSELCICEINSEFMPDDDI